MVMRSLFIGGLVASVPLLAVADVTLASVFADHAILQCDKPLPVWGRAGPGETVTVSFRGATAHTTAGSDGRWRVVLGSFTASRKPAELSVTGRNAVVVTDVLVGEVWLISGQSNMEFGVYRGRDAAAEISAADYPLIRELKIQHTVATRPAEEAANGGWRAASPQTAGEFSAVGYFFARELFQKLQIPVGIVNSSWGGTAIESWLGEEARQSTSLGIVLAERWRQALAEWPPARVAEYQRANRRWEEADKEAKKTGAKNPIPWPPPPATNDSPSLPGGLYNGMIAPLAPFALRGMLWYQGEGNAVRAGEYHELFTTMIRSWRQRWKDTGLPFYFVQLPNYHEPEDSTNLTWANLRAAQARATSLPHTGMAVTLDIGETNDIHPKNKQDVGHRLALIAEAKSYGLPVEFSGPCYDGLRRVGSTLRLSFQHLGGRLILRNGSNSSFKIAGDDRIFHPASAKIDGDTLVVSSPMVAAPVAVRYAWENSPIASLFGGTGLPAAPFRTDDW